MLINSSLEPLMSHTGVRNGGCGLHPGLRTHPLSLSIGHHGLPTGSHCCLVTRYVRSHWLTCHWNLTLIGCWLCWHGNRLWAKEWYRRLRTSQQDVQRSNSVVVLKKKTFESIQQLVLTAESWLWIEHIPMR